MSAIISVGLVEYLMHAIQKSCINRVDKSNAVFLVVKTTGGLRLRAVRLFIIENEVRFFATDQFLYSFRMNQVREVKYSRFFDRVYITVNDVNVLNLETSKRKG